MRLYGSIEEVVPMCLVKKNMASPYASHSAPPPPPKKKKKQEKKFQDLDSLSKFTD